MRYRLRRVELGDVESLRRLFGGSSGDSCLRLALVGVGVVAVSVDEGGAPVVGVAGLGPSFGDQPVELAVFVAPAWRGRGVGRALAEAAQRLADECRVATRPRPTVLGDAA
jgi:GNAT superfamily N-acetyltransferase